MSDQLFLDCYPNTAYIPVTNQTYLLYLLVAVRAGELDATGRVPVNLSLVVDKSDSMCIPTLTEAQFKELASEGVLRQAIVDGTPVWRFERRMPDWVRECPRNIDFVKTALRWVLEQLRPDDRFALTAFAGQAVTLVPNQAGRARRKLQAVIEELEEMQLGNETYMAKGLELGYQEVKRGGSSSTVDRLVVLTDGFTRDAERCRELAHQAAQAGISISTMGVGSEFNEDLLIAIADDSGGNAHFIHQAEEIPQAFAQELKGVQSIALRNLELKFWLAAGMELRRVYRVRPIIYDLGQIPLQERSFNLPLGDLEKDNPPSVLLELIIPPRPEGKYRLAQVVLAYDDPLQGQPGDEIRGDVIVQYTSDPNLAAQYDPRVMNLVETVSAFKLQTRALEDAERGNTADASRKLRSAATRLMNMGEEELAEAALQEIENLQKQGRMSTTGTKKLRYGTRKLTQKLEE